MRLRSAGFAAASRDLGVESLRHLELLREGERVARRDELLDVGPHPCDRLGRDLARGEARLGAAQHDLDLHQLVEGLGGMVDDLQASRADAFDQALVLELAQRLSHRESG